MDVPYAIIDWDWWKESGCMNPSCHLGQVWEIWLSRQIQRNFYKWKSFFLWKSLVFRWGERRGLPGGTNVGGDQMHWKVLCGLMGFDSRAGSGSEGTIRANLLYVSSSSFPSFFNALNFPWIFLSNATVVSGVSSVPFWNSFSDFLMSSVFSTVTKPWPLS